MREAVYDVRIKVKLVDGQEQTGEAVRLNLVEGNNIDGVQLDVMASNTREPGVYELTVVGAIQLPAGALNLARKQLGEA